MSEDNNTYLKTRWVLAEAAEEIDKFIIRLQKKASRLGVPEPIIRYTGNEQIAKIPVYDSEGNFCPDIEVNALKRELIITGQMPKVEGHQLLARIEHQKIDGEYSNMVLPVNRDSEKTLSEEGKDLHQCPPNCDHCSTERARKTTFLLSQDNNKDIIQVGSTCVDDFLGKRSLHQIMGAFDLHTFIMQDEQWDEMEHNLKVTPNRYFPLKAYLALASIETERNGFRPALAGEESTKYALLLNIQHNKNLHHGNKEIVLRAFDTSFTHPEYDKAQKIINWVNQADNGDMYLNNAKELMKRDNIDLNARGVAGLLASIPAAYKRNAANLKLKEKNTGKENKAESRHIGTIGEKGVLKLTLYRTYLHKVDNGYSPYDQSKMFYSFNDDDGNEFVWAKSLPEDPSLTKGDTFYINGKIAKHDDYKGTKQTSINYCKVLDKVSPDVPVPDFNVKPKDLPFNASFSASLSVADEKGNIHGVPLLLVTRTWQEANKRTQSIATVPVPLNDNFADVLMDELLHNAGISRKHKFGEPHKNDVQFYNDFIKECARYINLPEPKGEMYLVEDTRQNHLDVPLTHPDDTEKKEHESPAIFFDEASAMEHVKYQPYPTRLTVFTPTKWETAYVSTSDFNAIGEHAKSDFFFTASREGYNNIVLLNNDLHVDKILPVKWSPDTIKNQINIHRTTTMDVPKIDDSLSNRKFIAITSVNDTAALRAIKSITSNTDNLLSLLAKDIVPEVMPDIQQGKTLVKLPDILANDGFREASTNGKTALIYMDPSTANQLIARGASVSEIALIDKDNKHAPNPRASVINVDAGSVSEMAELIIKKSIHEMTENTLKNTNRI